ncbi:MAG TPA: formate dehydrogenase accessory sulfurtransferase FdhD [bacterium]|nr:formate dehydrogenase accessory sulfurtransferase FdhD [bacterium]
MEPTVTMDIAKWAKGAWTAIKDVVVREDAITVYLNERELVRLHCSPEHLDELAVGYLSATGIIQGKNDLLGLETVPAEGVVYVRIPGNKVRADASIPPSFIPSCQQGPGYYHCWQDNLKLFPITAPLKMKPKLVLELLNQLDGSSSLFKLTGGVHNAGLGTKQGLVLFRQDIGRHNAVDKVIGHMIINTITAEDKVLLLSGRISADIVFKAVVAGIPVLISPSAPTHLGVNWARRLGITVVGFVRDERFSVYSETWRLQHD